MRCARTQPGTRRVLACGGGVHNPLLLQRIAARLPGVVVESTAAHGARSGFRRGDGVRLAGAARRWPGGPGNLPAVTGARGPRVLGAVYPA